MNGSRAGLAQKLGVPERALEVIWDGAETDAAEIKELIDRCGCNKSVCGALLERWFGLCTDTDSFFRFYGEISRNSGLYFDRWCDAHLVTTDLETLVRLAQRAPFGSRSQDRILKRLKALADAATL
jgi:hypothetical protein